MPKEKDIISGSNTFFKLLDALQLPQQALFGAVRGLGKGDDLLQSIEDATRDNVSFEDLLDDLGVPKGKVRTVAGLAGDVVADPLNLLAIGPVAKAVTTPIKLGAKATGVTRFAKAAAAGRAGNVVRRTVSPTFGLEGAPREAVESVLEARRALSSQKGRTADAAFRIQTEGFDAAQEAAIRGQGGATLLDPGIRAEEVPGSLMDAFMRPGGFPAEGPIVLESFKEGGKRLGITENQYAELVAYNVERVTGSKAKVSMLPEKDGIKITKPKPKKEPFSTLPPGVKPSKWNKVITEDPVLKLDPIQATQLELGSLPSGLSVTANKSASTYASFIDGLDPKIVDDPIVRQWASVFKQTREAQNALNASRGMLTLKLNDESLDYLLHLTTTAFRKKAYELEEFAGMGREWSAAHTSQLARQWRGLSIADINKRGKLGTLPGFDGIKFEKVMEDNPVALELVRQFRDFKARVSTDLFQDLAIKGLASGRDEFVLGIRRKVGGFARRLDDGLPVPEGWRKIDIMPAPGGKASASFLKMRSKSPLAAAFDNIAWHPDVAQTLQRFVDFTHQSGIDDSLFGQLLGYFDDAQDSWKILTLGIRPAYHSRNAVGNTFLNYLAGVGFKEGPLGQFVPVLGANSPYKIAARIQAGASEAAGQGGRLSRATQRLLGKAPETVDIGGKNVAMNDLLTMAESMGVVKTGQYLGDVLTDVGQKKGFGISQRLAGKGGKFPGITKAVKTGQKVGGAIEDNARLAHFIDRLQKGDSASEAAASVKKFLFNYSELTDFERKVLRRAIPFYSWFRNNSVLQIDSLITKPYKYQPIADIINTVQSETKAPTEEEKILPDFIKDMSGVRIRRDADNNPEYFLLGAWLPAADIEDLAKPFFGRDAIERLDPIIGRMSPFIQKPIELTTNQSLFFRDEIERFPGEKQKFLGVEIQKKYVNLIKSLIIINEADRIINGGIIPGFSDRTPQSIGENLAQTLGGLKVFPIQESRALATYFYKKERGVGELVSALRRARRTGDDADARTLERLIRKAESEF